ncbi:hypothetical protein TrRE_jg13398 [Triparma retinervis]|uniref:Uncharacterized protein n=1 Tax=Triparma retinervis TaxID=2557542 RepID=A0A9W6ZKK6_9STRA|nr:hypothetical protein TrRE_jg13398 [Triparma retinervis]
MLCMYFAAGLIVFDIMYLGVHGKSITSPERESDVSQGTKFALAMYIIALLFKLPLLFLLFKSYVLLSDPEGSSGSPKVLRGSHGGAVSSPLATSSHYDVNSPYDPAPVASPSGVEMTMMGSPPPSGGGHRPPPPPAPSPYGVQPPLPPS